MSDCPPGFILVDGKCVPDLREPLLSVADILGFEDWSLSNKPVGDPRELRIAFCAGRSRGLAAGRAEVQALFDQIDALAKVILEVDLGEPAGSYGACEAAINLIRRYAALQKRIDDARPHKVDGIVYKLVPVEDHDE